MPAYLSTTTLEAIGGRAMQSYDGYHSGRVDLAAGAWSRVQHVGQPHHEAPASPLDTPRWLLYVEGGEVVGPVSANLVARGIRAGRVPTEASIQAAGEVFWTGVLDEPAVIAALRAI